MDARRHSACATTTSCIGTADESRTSITYGTNFNPASVTTASGDGTLSATTAIAYDSAGNVISVDGPLSGTADTTRARYDALRRQIGTVSPDPDGSGPLPARATRTTYNPDGTVQSVEAGTDATPVATDFGGFSSAQQNVMSYDAYHRLVKTSLTASGQTYAISQQSYDALSRVDCAVQRMDPTQWTTQSDACVPQTTGASGPDRISRNYYDAANRLVRVTSAYGTADAADDASITFTVAGNRATATDGANNTTTYEYDGFDRLTKIRYPVAATGAGTSSTTDYEQATLDAAGNVTVRRLRDGRVIGYGYDFLGRLTLQDLPSPESDISYSYDLLGRALTVSQGTVMQTMTYDALGRLRSEVQPFGTTSYAYDLAGSAR